MEGLQITVIMQQDGSISVNGPINNLVLCYGLLEAGKDALRKFAAEQAEKRIVAPPPGLRIVNPEDAR